VKWEDLSHISPEKFLGISINSRVTTSIGQSVGSVLLPKRSSDIPIFKEIKVGGWTSG
jgi:hypothetical protein